MPRAIKTVLIANRGEIALRIVRTCRRLGIRTVAICSAVDQFHPHTHFADVRVVLGATPREVYLSPQAIVDAAISAGADAIHPGYGYLSESAEFAERIESAGLGFIGPTPDTLRLFGEKHRARELALSLQIPIAPGFHEREPGDVHFMDQALTLGFPLIVKAVAGGGGRGMRRVDSESELRNAVLSARAEALRAFGDERLLVERLIQDGRHVEVQLLGDGRGTVIHFGDRDCSLQRRYQKIIEEAPAPDIGTELRAELYSAAVRLGVAANLRSAATVEFLVLSQAEATHFGMRFLFLEANCRIQVEHPVTEEVTRSDLIAEQIAVASGCGVSRTQQEVRLHGHAIELRLYAEDPAHDFVPQIGELRSVSIPVAKNLRIDHVLFDGSRVLSDFDPLIGKLIGWGASRGEAIRAVISALDGLSFRGVATNELFLRDVIHSREFLKGGFPTSALSRVMEELRREQHALVDAVGCITAWSEVVGFSAGHDPIFGIRRMRAGATRVLRPAARYRVLASLHSSEISIRVVDVDTVRQCMSVEIDGRRSECRLLNGGLMAVNERECEFRFRRYARDPDGSVRNRIELNRLVFDVFQLREAVLRDHGLSDRHPVITTHLPGNILRVLVARGDVIEPGTIVCTIDSMKMEHQIRAVESGVVEAVLVQTGESVSSGQFLLRFQRSLSTESS